MVYLYVLFLDKVIFWTGAGLGSALSAYQSSSWGTLYNSTPLVCLVGGACMVFGARFAQGCTRCLIACSDFVCECEGYLFRSVPLVHMLVNSFFPIPPVAMACLVWLSCLFHHLLQCVPCLLVALEPHCFSSPFIMNSEMHVEKTDLYRT